MAEIETKKHSLAKNAVFNVAYSMLDVLFPIISTSYVSHILFRGGVGKVAYAQNIASYFVLLAALGIPTYGVREIAKAKTKKEESAIFTELFIINGGTTLISLLIYLVMITQFEFFQARAELHLIFASLIFLNFFNIDWYYRGKEEYVYISVRSAIVKLISLLAIFIFVRTLNDYAKYAVITCAATAGNYIFNFFHLRKFHCFCFHDLHFWRHMKPILMLLVCSLAGELYSKIDTTMIGSMCSDDAVGLYTNAHKLVNTVISLTIAVTGVFLPRLSYHYQNDKAEFSRLVNLGFIAVITIAIPSCLGTILVGYDTIALLFGVDFLPAAPTLYVLSLLILIKSWGDMLCYKVTIAANKERYLVYVYSVAAAMNIALNWVLINKMSYIGAAVASVISELFVNVALLMINRKEFKLAIPRKYTASMLLSTAGMAAAVIGVKVIGLSYAPELFISVIVGVCVFFAINILLKNPIVISLGYKLHSRFLAKR